LSSRHMSALYSYKRHGSPKNENMVIVYSPVPNLYKILSFVEHK